MYGRIKRSQNLARLAAKTENFKPPDDYHLTKRAKSGFTESNNQ